MDAETKRLRKKKVNHDWYMAHREDEIAKSAARQRAQQGDPEYNRARVGYVMAFIQRNPAKTILRVMRQNARSRNIPCTIELSELEKLLAPMTCSVTGLPLRWDKSIVRDEFAPSPDQVIQGLGYVPGNVRIVAWVYNRMRGELSDVEFVERLRMLLERLS